MRLAADHQLAALHGALLERASRQLGAELVDALLSAPQRTEYEHPRSSASASTSCWSGSRASTARSRGTSSAVAGAARAAQRVDRRRRRLGLRHRLGRPRPRARQRPRRERAGARHRGLLEHRRAGVEGHAPRRRRQVRQRAASAPRRRTSRCRPSPTATSTSRASRWGPTRSRRSTPSARPRPTTGRRSSWPTRTASRTASTCARASTSRAAPCTPATGRWCATTRSCAPRASTPFTLDSVRPTLPFRAYAERELRYRMLLLSDPPRGEALLRAAQEAVDRKWKQVRRPGAAEVRRWQTCPPRTWDLSLPHPVVASAGPLSHDLDGIRRLEDGGAAAIVLFSLFEEQIRSGERGAVGPRPPGCGEHRREASSLLPADRRLRRRVRTRTSNCCAGRATPRACPSSPA